MPVYIPRVFGGTIILSSNLPVPTLQVQAVFRSGVVESVHRDGKVESTHRDGKVTAGGR